MDANDTYLKLAQDDNLAAALVHIENHMQKGLDQVYASLEVS